MRCMLVAGRGLCLAAVGAALVAVIVSGASALSYGQNDGALVAAFFGALVALVSSLWVCARFFGERAQAEEPVRPVWYVGPPIAPAAPAVTLPPLAPRTPGWGPYRAEAMPSDSVLSSPDTPYVPSMDDTQKVTIAPTAEAADASDTRPMKAIQTTADTRRVQRPPYLGASPQAEPSPRLPVQPDSLPESLIPPDVDRPVRPTKLAL